ncbi:hypothetical protein BDU57DRAFT_533791 [Ampelomyces quisqualis]|uniref:Uncharacterized protein n=1 Tax=Ampelomyces quisqualis TaxID=50730 RepID=A0A6A5Q4K0_AMPQU|nr:hypothetical protein BDU57DRAFT_533791 [Ampelomyces quisqualis]
MSRRQLVAVEAYHIIANIIIETRYCQPKVAYTKMNMTASCSRLAFVPPQRIRLRLCDHGPFALDVLRASPYFADVEESVKTGLGDCLHTAHRRENIRARRDDIRSGNRQLDSRSTRTRTQRHGPAPVGEASRMVRQERRESNTMCPPSTSFQSGLAFARSSSTSTASIPSSRIPETSSVLFPDRQPTCAQVIISTPSNRAWECRTKEMHNLELYSAVCNCAQLLNISFMRQLPRTCAHSTYADGHHIEQCCAPSASRRAYRHVALDCSMCSNPHFTLAAVGILGWRMFGSHSKGSLPPQRRLHFAAYTLTQHSPFGSLRRNRPYPTSTPATTISSYLGNDLLRGSIRDTTTCRVKPKYLGLSETLGHEHPARKDIVETDAARDHDL